MTQSKTSDYVDGTPDTMENACDLAQCCQLKNQIEHPWSNKPLLSTHFIPMPQDPHQSLSNYYEHFSRDVHDLNLTNLSIWAKRHHLHYIIQEAYLFYVYYPTDKEAICYSEPVGNISDTVGLLSAVKALVAFSRTARIPLRFRRVSSEFKDLILQHFEHVEVSSNEDYFDYCYPTEDLAKLSGNRYHKKKNHLNQFLKKHDGRYTMSAITNENALDALEAATQWCQTNGCKGDYDLCYEFQGISKLLKTWDVQKEYGLEGVIVYVDHNPVAFSLAEPWHQDTLLVHIEKGDTQYPGIYAAVNYAMANQALGRFAYLNREQDMGIEGIRKAKRSYLPSHLVEKFNLVLENSQD